MPIPLHPDLFQLDPTWYHFASFFLAPTPLPVREATLRFQSELEQNPFEYLFSNGEALEDRVRVEAARYIGAPAEGIALVGSTTEGLALVYGGLALKEGDEILFSSHDHYSLRQCLRYRKERLSIELHQMTLYPKKGEATVEEMQNILLSSITARTRVVHFTWVHSGTGVQLPLRRLIEVVREENERRDESDHILTVVDGVHGLAVIDEDVSSLGCNFFIAGTHKWLFGPRGTGIVWGDGVGWRRVHPSIPPFAPFSRAEPGVQMTPGGFHSFEHRWALADAFIFMNQLTRSETARYTSLLNTRLKEKLLTHSDITLHTPLDPTLSAGLTCFTSRRKQASEIVAALRERRVAATLAPGTRYVRLGPSIINSESEVDDVVKIITEILSSP